jgi:hypothetical protein
MQIGDEPSNAILGPIVDKEDTVFPGGQVTTKPLEMVL